MKDRYDRKIDYARISLTDKCNLRCIYCRPNEEVCEKADKKLSKDNIVKIAKALAKVGIIKIKLTGGEPLIRDDIGEITKEIKEIDGIDNVTITTNGLLLPKYIDALYNGGIDCINISLNSLNKEIYEKIAGRDTSHKAKEALDALVKYKDLKRKINCVPIKGIVNDNSILNLVEIARTNKIPVRFIEMMPIGYGVTMDSYKENEIISLIENHYNKKLIPTDEVMGNGPCHYFNIEGFEGKIGFISAISNKFCSNCNRIRITSDGYLKTCLQYDFGLNLNDYLGQDKSVDELADAIKKTIYNKPLEHSFEETNRDEIDHREIKKMFQIGG